MTRVRRSPDSPPQAHDREAEPFDAAPLRDSAIVPARVRRTSEPQRLYPATVLRAPSAQLTRFGSSIAGSDGVLLVGGRSGGDQPYAALYRIESDRAQRALTLRGAAGHTGPVLATDGQRIVASQPSSAPGASFATVYRLEGDELPAEATLRQDELSDVGERIAIGGELLVLGQSASVSVYRHSAVGWLAAATLQPRLPYAWNPSYGGALAVVAGRVLVGNPVEVDGHRAGPGRVFVYRPRADGVLLESVLTGDGIECGRDEAAAPGFGASLTVQDDLVIVTAPHEITSEGQARSKVYLMRAQSGTLARVAQTIVPSCQHGVCLVRDKLFVLGDQLYVFERRGAELQASRVYDAVGATSITRCGELIALAHPSADAVSLHFAQQL